MSTPFLEDMRAFVKEHVLGREAYFDDHEAMPPLPVFRAMHERRLLHWWIPAQHGGRGLPISDGIDVLAELAYGDPGLACTFPPALLGSMPIVLWGTEEQKERFLRPMAEQGGFAAMLGSERGAGSELLRTETTAEKDGDHYVINGDKFFASNAEHADFWVVLARAKDPPQFKAIIVPRGTPGATVVKRWPTIGIRACATYQTKFEGCRVPANLVLPVHGLRALEASLNASRALLAASMVGATRRMRDLCLAYGKQKPLKNATLLESPVFAAKLGQMEMEIEAMYQICKTAARELDERTATEDGRKRLLKSGTLKSAIVAKMLCGQLGYRIAAEASTMFGGLGYTDESLIGKLVRDVRCASIIEAGDDVLRELMFHRYARSNTPA
jgi:alkylation response protein AidB-like acyl-CoA dehydrogenase